MNISHNPAIELDEEDAYDKFEPTDRSKVEEYKKQEQKSHPHRLEEFIITEPKTLQDEETKIRINRPIGVYTPPENFAMVCGSIYRSSFPRVENFEFLQTLNLKSVLCLIPEEYPPENLEFNKVNGIRFFQVGLSGNKEPFVKIKPELVTEALKIITNPANQPILIHCNRGKHRTGCIVGCVRKLQKWSLSMIFDEYRKFAYPKERPLDQQFIEMYDDTEIELYASERHWLPLHW
ncbi:tyrosine-protein phosphatase siw14 [Brettanomyces nanus]|uniref:diphosphoinositol-polyphosphate diphosphatase n=1 Tax=Eeniella nana TaxID=13502 RepID=A0A875RPU1_EENNA|nr:tyrosine-protein phosphatase siw14 [Brettanomyces nanus]QPG75460.1 tyrosine-protein phosphatase siw14 [Brettanomyces nanus]